MKLKSKIEKVLPHISKPSRYITGELNSIIKPSEEVDFRFALAFPDTYEIGMSHLGIQILYEILNRLDGIQAERVFTPWIDMADKMKEEDIPLFSQETMKPISEFDVLGFSLQYELSYTNVVMMLDLAQIPLLSKERTDSVPIVIAGGPCVFNPEPMVDFIDAFVIGDAEDAVLEIVEALRNAPEEREEKLRSLHKIDGIYVPLFSETEELEDGTVVVKDTEIKKRFVKDLDSAVFPTQPVLPYMPAIHDRIRMEVLRGCTQGCRFCQAGIIYRPVRERSLDEIERLAEESIDSTGYEEISLVSLSTCDYSKINELIEQIVEISAPRNVGVALPSTRIDSFSIDLAEMVQNIRKTGLTFAPEAGTEELRAKINKPISNSGLISKCEEIYARGWNLIKLYFMIGLPMETDEDVRAIAELAQEILYRGRKRNRRANLNLSVSNFVPKPHTPFQWSEQNSIEEIERKQKLLQDNLSNRRINLKYHDARLSFLEGVFSRGDRRLGRVILEAYRLGCRFDGWTDEFKFDRWMKAFGWESRVSPFAFGKPRLPQPPKQKGDKAFERYEIKPEEYLREREIDEPLPWEHINTLVKKEFLLKELECSLNGEVTLDCRINECKGCGIVEYWTECIEKTRQKGKKAVKPEGRKAGNYVQSGQPSVQKIRIQFTKTKLLRFLSHLEILNVITRAFRRQRIPVAFSGGFHPQPKIAFSAPTSVGVISIAEFADIELHSEMLPQKLMTLLNQTLPSGLQILSVREIPKNAPSLMSEIEFSKYHIQISNSLVEDENKMLERIQILLNSDEIWIDRVRKDKVKKVELRRLVKEIEFLTRSSKVTVLECILRDGSTGKGQPEEVVGYLLEIDSSERDKLLELSVIKTDTYIPSDEELISPMERIYQNCKSNN